MERKILMILAFAASTGAVMAAETAPSDVAYLNGSVETSLTGIPGDPENGRKIVGDKGAGNCIACHKVTDLSDVPWHGEIGPMLDGAGERWTDAQLRGIVTNAKMMFDESLMPSFYKVDGFVRPGDAYTGKAATDIAPLLDAQQIEDVVAYLITLKEYY